MRLAMIPKGLIMWDGWLFGLPHQIQVVWECRYPGVKNQFTVRWHGAWTSTEGFCWVDVLPDVPEWLQLSNFTAYLAYLSPEMWLCHVKSKALAGPLDPEPISDFIRTIRITWRLKNDATAEPIHCSCSWQIRKCTPEMGVAWRCLIELQWCCADWRFLLSLGSCEMKKCVPTELIASSWSFFCN